MNRVRGADFGAHQDVLGRWCRAARCLRGGFGDGLGGVLGGATGTKQAVIGGLCIAGPAVAGSTGMSGGMSMWGGGAGRLIQAGRRGGASLPYSCITSGQKSADSDRHFAIWTWIWKEIDERGVRARPGR